MSTETQVFSIFYCYKCYKLGGCKKQDNSEKLFSELSCVNCWYLCQAETLFTQQMLPDIYNISGSHGDEQITLLAVGEQIILNLIKGREILAGSSQFLNTLLQIFRRNSQSIGFSCCINIRNYHMICQAECFGKLRKQSFGTGICMWLEYTP